MANEFTQLTALRIDDGVTNLHVDVTFCADGDTFVGVHDPDHGTTITMTLADFRRAAAAVERKVA